MEITKFKLKVTAIERQSSGKLRVKAADKTMSAVVYFDYTGLLNLDEDIEVTIAPAAEEDI